MNQNVSAPALWIVAGPNGVGKTTFATSEILELSGVATFLNLDLIAQGISPLDPNLEQMKAGRIALGLMRDAISRRITFTIETTLAGRGQKGLIAEARTAGYVIHLLYFYVSCVEEALRRIEQRVADGGHDVPKRDATRRYARSLLQLGSYAAMCDSWRIYDTDNPTPRLRATGTFAVLTSHERIAEPRLPEQIEAWLTSIQSMSS